MAAFDQRIKTAFLRFRASPAFAWTILTISAVWWTTNSWIYHFDPGLANFLTMISIEASVAACLILEQGNAQQQQVLALMSRQERMVEQVLELTKAVKALVENVEDDVEGIADKVGVEET